MTFHAYASGSTGNFYVVEDGDSRLGIEAGLKFKDMQIASGFTISRMDGLLISHAHGDHARSVARVMAAGVDCYASNEAWAKMPKTHRSKKLEPMALYNIGAFVVKPFEVPHDENEPGTLGFLVKGPSGSVLLYCTDANYLPSKFSGVDILAVEANHCEDILRRNVEAGYLDPEVYKRVRRSHTSIQTVLKMLAANDLSGVREIHLLHLSNGNSDEESFKEQVMRATGIRTIVAKERNY